MLVLILLMHLSHKVDGENVNQMPKVENKNNDVHGNVRAWVDKSNEEKMARAWRGSPWNYFLCKPIWDTCY